MKPCTTVQHKRELDATDKKLLTLLQENGRATNQWLAQQVGLSPTPCLERVRRLENDGFIVGYEARLAPDMVGLPLMIFALISFDRAIDGVYEEFRKGIADIGEIIECYMITGDVDFVMKIRTSDIGSFRILLEEKILKLPGVRITHSYVVMDDTKVTNLLPIPESV